MDLTDLIETDQYLDALGKQALSEWERILKKPRMVIYRPEGITSYDIFGEKIPELTGPYTDELKERLGKAKDEKTEEIDRIL